MLSCPVLEHVFSHALELELILTLRQQQVGDPSGYFQMLKKNVWDSKNKDTM